MTLALAVFVVTAASVFPATNATADVGGHFTSSVAHTEVIGTESGTAHQIHFKAEGAAGGARSGCAQDSYTATFTGETTESIAITPSWAQCSTTGSEILFQVHENGCQLIYKIGDVGTHHTAELSCATGKAIEVTHPNCTIKVPPQIVSGVVYTPSLAPDGSHTITLDSTSENITTHYESGICVFLGTTHEHEMSGSVTVEGFSTDGNRVDITATTTS